MAEVTFIAPVAKIKGKLHQKDRTVFRKKMVRDDEGRIIAEMKQEAYVVKHPRDWKKKPAEGAEKLKQDRWAEACAKTKQILDNPELRAYWQQEWKSQLKQAAADAPIDPRTNRPKIYIKFDCYVRAKVWRELELAASRGVGC